MLLDSLRTAKPQAMKIDFWNNKGGVGKIFLCFATASEYA